MFAVARMGSEGYSRQNTLVGVLVSFGPRQWSAMTFPTYEAALDHIDQTLGGRKMFRVVAIPAGYASHQTMTPESLTLDDVDQYLWAMMESEY